jgi:low affinity Fe/Cu permease
MKLSVFTQIAKVTAKTSGHSATFFFALGTIVIWGLTGPLFGWSDTWQLVINTGTTIITFLMVFLIQNSQNRDTEALQLKLDELIRANKDARNTLLNLEELDEAELDDIKESFLMMAKRAHDRREAM